MTDNDIIKALERMAFIESRKGEVQKQKVLESAAEIINRQKAEIYKLEGSLIEEITRRENAVRAYNEARTEAIKEFAERLKEEYRGFDETHHQIFYSSLVACIDNLVKERVGDQK